MCHCTKTSAAPLTGTVLLPYSSVLVDTQTTSRRWRDTVCTPPARPHAAVLPDTSGRSGRPELDADLSTPSALARQISWPLGKVC